MSLHTITRHLVRIESPIRHTATVDEPKRAFESGFWVGRDKAGTDLKYHYRAILDEQTVTIEVDGDGHRLDERVQ